MRHDDVRIGRGTCVVVLGEVEVVDAQLDVAVGEQDERIRDNHLVAALVAAGEGLALLPRYTTRSADEFALVPLVDVPSARWIVALSRPDRAERAAVRLVTRQLGIAGAALMGERIS